MVQAQRGDGQDGNAVFIDEERILVRAVGRSPVLDDAQAPGRDLLADAMVQHDHAVRDELLDPVPGQLVGPVPLGGDDRGQALLLQPAEQPADFGAQDAGVGQLAEERFKRVEDDALRANPLDGVGNSNEETIEVVLPGLGQSRFA